MAKARKISSSKKQIDIKAITFHNKDVLLKFLGERYRDKSLKVYGLDLPRIVRMLPSNLPVVSANERKSDNIFLLEDDSILIIEYETHVTYINLIKYAHYGFRVCEAYNKKKLHKVNLVVVYTGEVEEAPSSLDLGCIHLSFIQVFLSKFNGQEMYEDLKRKIETGERLSEEDPMRFILLPLAKNDDRQKALENAIKLAKEIKDEEIQNFVLAGIITAADKFISEEESKNVREWISLTKVEKIIEREKIEELNKKDEIIKQKDIEIVDIQNKLTKEKVEAIKEAIKKTEEKSKKETARNLLSDNVDTLIIMKATGLEYAEILKLKEEILDKSL
ncbi:MAG: transcriptional regulator [Oscillospiraceae bacterium]|nr:transcriptional regulator [Oscillospiraceae bacterium]